MMGSHVVPQKPTLEEHCEKTSATAPSVERERPRSYRLPVTGPGTKVIATEIQIGSKYMVRAS
jgi:hypothetical protein